MIYLKVNGQGLWYTVPAKETTRNLTNPDTKDIMNVNSNIKSVIIRKYRICMDRGV